MRRVPMLAAALAAFSAPVVSQSASVERPAGLKLGGSQPHAATASYGLYGNSCGSRCAVLNDKGGTQRTGTLPNEYGYAVVPSAATTIIGFQLWTNATSAATHIMTCALYRGATPTTPMQTPFAKGTMTIERTLQFYTVVLDKPVAVKANERIWISQYDTSAVLASAKTNGRNPPGTTFWRRPAGSPTATWRPTGIIRFPVWRIICQGDLLLSNTGVPKIGGSFSVDLRGVKPSSIGVLMMGGTNPRAALGCTLAYASFDLNLFITADRNGRVSRKITIPNNPWFDGKTIYNQFWVLSGNSVVGTNGGAMHFGK